MADVKQYAYYPRGRDLAIIEVDVNVNTLPNAGIYRGTTWKSPLTTVSDGILLEYVAIPKAKDGGNITDESDDIDISDLYAKAIVYYLKAKIAEDQGNFQLRDVMFKEFYRIVEKSDNAKIHTIRRVAVHSAAIR